VREAAAKVAALGLPETIVHGDFHTGNAALVDRRAVIIDWSDAALASPAIDLVTWITWGRGEIGDVGPAVDAWIDAWAAVADPAALRQGLDDVLVVGAAYQVVSYDGIVRALEPATRYTMAGGASHFLRRLEAVVAGRGRVGR
jgi:aminoglycoside phosphotransferase (APT) family kinase protein